MTTDTRRFDSKPHTSADCIFCLGPTVSEPDHRHPAGLAVQPFGYCVFGCGRRSATAADLPDDYDPMLEPDLEDGIAV